MKTSTIDNNVNFSIILCYVLHQHVNTYILYLRKIVLLTRRTIEKNMKQSRNIAKQASTEFVWLQNIIHKLLICYSFE